MLRSGVFGIGLGMTLGFGALGVLSASCLNTSGLAGGPEPTTDAGAVEDTTPVNPNPCGKDLQKDLANCGTCGNVCGFGANSFPLCTAGVCKIGCNTQYGNCDNDDKNGCEDILAGDPLNCSACGRNCGGGACTAGQCGAVNLAPKVDAGLADGYPLSLAMDATSLYYGWYSSTLGTYDIVKLDKTTGVAVVLATGPTFYQQFLTADDDPNGFLYFVRPYTTYFGEGSVVPYTPPTSGDGAILKLAKTRSDAGPGTPVVLAGSSGQGVAGGLFVDSNTRVVVTATGIYFTSYSINFYDGTQFVPVGTGVFKCPLTGACGSPTTLASNEYGTYSLAVDGAGFVFNNQQKQALYTCPLAGCPATPTLVQSTTSARMLLEDATNYYWINANSASIVKADRATNTPTILAPGQPSPFGLAVDAKNVYWTNGNNPGTLSYCPIAGCSGAPTALVQNISYPRTLLSDATALYWMTISTGGSLFKVVK